MRPESSLKDATVPVEGKAIEAKGRTGERFAKVVFVVGKDQKVSLRRVRTGIASDTDIEILEGLEEGERIVEGRTPHAGQGAEGRRRGRRGEAGAGRQVQGQARLMTPAPAQTLIELDDIAREYVVGGETVRALAGVTVHIAELSGSRSSASRALASRR